MNSYGLVTFDDGGGWHKPGLLVDQHVLDLAQYFSLPPRADMIDLFAQWSEIEKELPIAAKAAAASGVPLEEVTIHAPVERPLAIYCAGANYRDHVDNMARARGIPTEPDPHDRGLRPWHFLKSGRTVCGPNAAINLECANLDWEAEIAAVIGLQARNVSERNALDHVAGYMIANDLSARDRMVRENGEPGSTFYYDWAAHKSFEQSCPLGPIILPASNVGNPQNIDIQLWVNSELKQNSNSRHMLFSIAEQIAHISTYVTLHPGDIVLTGTPAGVGAETGTFLKKGDTVRTRITGMGEQNLSIV
ncbi:fumarylacetoacetate hydrolase family protein [Pelagibacterium sp.]|uniref:fumarylacetoacetate hydrolase family protein n=1 Tax=Pelagibacterium sp. TaxID=1967288 RepID=UPI003A8F79B2